MPDDHACPTRRDVLKTTGAAALGSLAVGSGAWSLCRAEPVAGGADILSAPTALFRPTSSGCTLHWAPKQPLQARILAGRDPERLAVVAEVNPDAPTQYTLDGMTAGSDYFVQCRFRRPGAQNWIDGEVRRIQTARPSGSTFRVALVADSHVYIAAHSPERMLNIRKTIDAVLADRPDFVIFLGDEGGIHSLKDPPGSMNAVLAYHRWLLWRTTFAPLLAAVPAFLVLGNHEGEAGFYRKRWHAEGTYFFQRWGTIARKKLLLNPNPDTYVEGGENTGWVGDPKDPATGGAAAGNRSPFQNYFAWTWGDALFVVLDVYRYTNVGGTTPTSVDQWTLGDEQLRWLSGVLHNSSQKWKFILCHHLVGGWNYDMPGMVKNSRYVYGRGGGRYARVGEQAQITELMRNTGAQFYLYGHDHIFAHQQADGVHFVCCGRPSYLGQNWKSPGWIEAYGDTAARNPNDFYGAIGYTRLLISPDQVNLRYVKTGTDPKRKDNVDAAEGEIVYDYSVVA